jgi:hypothetical protein
MKRIAICVLCLFLGFLAGFLLRGRMIGHGDGERPPEAKIEARTDTVTVEKPKLYEVRVTDTIRVVVTDTVRVHDTLYLSLPRERKVYLDTSYRAVVSGYMPSLDSMTVYQRTVTVTKINSVASRKRWSVGIGPSVGLGWVSPIGGNAGMGTYFGVGVSFSYNF